MIVDTGTTKTVVGSNTMETMLEDLSWDEKQSILKNKPQDEIDNKFRFGDGKITTAEKVIHIPVQIGIRVVKLKTYVLKGAVPFLLGIEAMKKMKATLEVGRNEITLYGTKISGSNNSSGHLVLNMAINKSATIGTDECEAPQCVFHLRDHETLAKTRFQMAVNLHKRFGQAHSAQLAKMIEHSEHCSKWPNVQAMRKDVEHITQDCNVCYEKRKRPNRPKNAFQRATRFNECVAIDLTEWLNKKNGSKNIIIHMIDEFSRLSVAKIIQNKQPETIVSTIFSQWFCAYGTPKQIIHDKGGVFVNEKMSNWLNVFGVYLVYPRIFPICKRYSREAQWHHQSHNE